MGSKRGSSKTRREKNLHHSSNPSLEELIRNKEMRFFSTGRALNTDIQNFGKSNWDLVKHITEQAGAYITLEGFRISGSLQKYLTDPKNLYTFASFLNKLWYGAVSAGKKQHPALHVNVDIDKVGLHYPKPAEEKLINGFGQVVCDAASWVPEMPYFEKVWNFALGYAIGGMMGSGYEHPIDDLSFRIRAAEHAENFMIGTPQQIQRYKKYVLESLNDAAKIADELTSSPALKGGDSHDGK